MKLLVSVRNPSEATTALAGGADIVDIKEPARGPLGRADHKTICQIIQCIENRVPVSAAMGELPPPPVSPAPPVVSQVLPPAPQAPPVGLAWTKLGLRQAPVQWRDRLADHFADPAKAVAAAYAEEHEVGAPLATEVLDWAIDFGASAILLDTAIKNGSCLFDHITCSALGLFIEKAHEAGLLVALAGSLKREHIPQARLLKADIFAVRGAACGQDGRQGQIQVARVKELKDMIETDCVLADQPANSPAQYASMPLKPL